MCLRIACAVVFVTAMSVAGEAANAGARHARGTARAADSQAPARDCTRFNGRYGYYGNLWCDERQQRQWDLWVDPRRVRSIKN